MLKLHRPELAVMRESMLAPCLMKWAETLATASFRVEEVGWEQWARTKTKEEKKMVSWLRDTMWAHSGGAVEFPLLSEEFCETLDYQFDIWCSQGHAKVNPAETQPYQIPEITLEDNCPALYRNLEVFHAFWIRSLSTFLLGFQCEHIQSIQLARYQAVQLDVSRKTGQIVSTTGGNYHVDADSDLSVVIPIRQKNLYTGGGVLIRESLDYEVSIEPIPVGHGLFFRGKTTLHKGIPVTSGCRDLLVYWTTVKYRG